jgi:hypothetical protein
MNACDYCPCPIGYTESADWHRRRLALIASGRRFYATKTLLGGEPDVNRRQIYDYAHPCGRAVETWNQEMNPWTEADERRLDARLAILNGAAPS